MSWSVANPDTGEIWTDSNLAPYQIVSVSRESFRNGYSRAKVYFYAYDEKNPSFSPWTALQNRPWALLEEDLPKFKKLYRPRRCSSKNTEPKTTDNGISVFAVCQRAEGHRGKHYNIAVDDAWDSMILPPVTVTIKPNPGEWDIQYNKLMTRRDHIMTYYGYDPDLEPKKDESPYERLARELEIEERWADPDYRARYCGLK